MTLADLSDPGAVVAAIEEYQRIGRPAFLGKYKSRGRYRYYLAYDGELYESKPIVAAAHGFQFRVPLRTADFIGGEQTVQRKLERLGFEVEVDPQPRASELTPGSLYSWAELGRQFGFKPAYLSVAGGMISRPDDGAVLVITHPGGAKVVGINEG